MAVPKRASRKPVCAGDVEKPLVFNHEDNDPVDILITMAAVNANTHQEVGIMQIVNLFDDEANLTVYAPVVPRRTCWI